MDRKSWEESGLMNIKGGRYDTSIELQKSLYMVDSLQGIYDFKIETTGVTILKILRNDNTKKITLDDLIYDIQIQLHHEICEYFQENGSRADAVNRTCYNLGEIHPGKVNQSLPGKWSRVEYNVRLFYHLFNTIDNINKAINNIIYLKKSLKERCEAEASGRFVKLNGMDGGVVVYHLSIANWINDDIVECDEFCSFDELYDAWERWCDEEGYHSKKRPEKREIKMVLLKLQEKTEYGLQLGKNKKDDCPNGTRNKPKFNLKPMDD